MNKINEIEDKTIRDYARRLASCDLTIREQLQLRVKLVDEIVRYSLDHHWHSSFVTPLLQEAGCDAGTVRAYIESYKRMKREYATPLDKKRRKAVIKGTQTATQVKEEHAVEDEAAKEAAKLEKQADMAHLYRQLSLKMELAARASIEAGVEEEKAVELFRDTYRNVVI
jgi:hypothetical protein